MSYTTDQINELLHDPDVTNKALCEALYNVHEDYLVLKEDIETLFKFAKSHMHCGTIHSSGLLAKLEKINGKG